MKTRLETDGRYEFDTGYYLAKLPQADLLRLMYCMTNKRHHAHRFATWLLDAINQEVPAPW